MREASLVGLVKHNHLQDLGELPTATLREKQAQRTGTKRARPVDSAALIADSIHKRRYLSSVDTQDRLNKYMEDQAAMFAETRQRHEQHQEELLSELRGLQRLQERAIDENRKEHEKDRQALQGLREDLLEIM